MIPASESSFQSRKAAINIVLNSTQIRLAEHGFEWYLKEQKGESQVVLSYFFITPQW